MSQTSIILLSSCFLRLLHKDITKGCVVSHTMTCGDRLLLDGSYLKSIVVEGLVAIPETWCYQTNVLGFWYHKQTAPISYLHQIFLRACGIIFNGHVWLTSSSAYLSSGLLFEDRLEGLVNAYISASRKLIWDWKLQSVLIVLIHGWWCVPWCNDVYVNVFVKL